MEIPINGGIEEGHYSNGLSGKALVELDKGWDPRRAVCCLPFEMP